MCQHSKQDGTDNQFTKSRVRVCNKYDDLMNPSAVIQGDEPRRA